MNILNHISYIAGCLHLKVKSQQPIAIILQLTADSQKLIADFSFDSDNLTSKKTIPENAKYCQYWEFLTVFWQKMIVNCQRMNVFKKYINFIVMSLLRELRGYNILYYGYIRYFFVNYFDIDNITSIKTIPIKAEYSQRCEFLITFSQKNYGIFSNY